MNKLLAVFDLDGTLVDSAKIVALILNQLRIELGKKAKPVEFFVPWLSLGGEDLVANGLGLPVDKVKVYLEDFRSRYADLPTPVDSVYDGVFDLLEYLKGRGIEVCICTNKPRNLAEKVLNETGLYRYFQFMCAGGDLKTKKPNPENLDACIKYFGQEYKKTILIGDSKIDQDIAGALDVDFAYFRGGYNDGVDESRVVFSFSYYSEVAKILN